MVLLMVGTGVAHAVPLPIPPGLAEAMRNARAQKQELEAWQKAHPRQRPSQAVIEGIRQRHPVNLSRPKPRQLTPAQLQRRQLIYQKNKAKADKQMGDFRQRSRKAGGR